MKQPQKFTIAHLNKLYPNEDACLDALFQFRHGDISVCPSCSKSTKFYRVAGRKCYACPFCGHQLHPLADTIFHKSSTPLKLWFHAIFLFACSRNGVSAKELERQLGVTYKTAWRMAHQIRKLFKDDPGMLDFAVEADEAYLGGRRRGRRGRGAEGKTPVIGVVERGGKVVAQATADTTAKTIIPLLQSHVHPRAIILTDEYRSYSSLRDLGYLHATVQHGIWQWAKDGGVHTNTIEGFWGLLKPSLKGTYRYVSRKYLQTYVDEFSFRYNHRHSPVPLFETMTQKAALPSQ